MTTSQHPGDRPMRRQDREIEDPAAVRSILKTATVLRLGLCDGEWPYVVPLNYGLHKDNLYFHCANEGKKLDLIRANPRVCFEVEGRVELLPGEKACDWSVKYESVIGYGQASIVADEAERRTAVAALVLQMGAEDPQLPEKLPASMPIVRIAIESLSGKTSMQLK